MSQIVEGIDISQHQGNVDFVQVAQAGYRFAIAKCSEGADYKDPKFLANMQAIAQLNASGTTFYAGAYHFARPDNRSGRSGGETEGRWFARQLLASEVNLDQNFLPPALDYEKYNDDGAQSNEEWVQGFLDVVEQETGRRPMIYTGPNVWMYQLGNSARFIEYGLWEVDYDRSGAENGATPTPMPKNDNTASWPWTLWQWSGGGDFAYAPPVPGVPGTGICDVNRFNGTLEELAALANP